MTKRSSVLYKNKGRSRVSAKDAADALLRDYIMKADDQGDNTNSVLRDNFNSSRNYIHLPSSPLAEAEKMGSAVAGVATAGNFAGGTASMDRFEQLHQKFEGDSTDQNSGQLMKTLSDNVDGINGGLSGGLNALTNTTLCSDAQTATEGTTTISTLPSHTSCSSRRKHKKNKKQKGEPLADYIVLACTELPLIMNEDDKKTLEAMGICILDPNYILAESLLRFGGYV